MMKDIFLVCKDFGISKNHTTLPNSIHEDDRIFIEKEDEKAKKIDLIVICVVVRGECVCVINDEEYTLRSHDMLMLLPETVIKKREHSDDLTVNCICVSKEMISNIVSMSLYNWDVLTYLMSYPKLTMNTEEMRRFNLYYELLDSKLSDESAACYKESVQMLMKSFMYDFHSVLTKYVKFEQPDFSQGRNLFKSFMDILATTYPRPRSVSYYADLLNVTPKYLSAVCKQNCGRTASSMIHKAVTKEIHELLVETTKSIKEIMVELDFPSLSFFGKYVKKHFGMGPKEYRVNSTLKASS